MISSKRNKKRSMARGQRRFVDRYPGEGTFFLPGMETGRANVLIKTKFFASNKGERNKTKVFPGRTSDKRMLLFSCLAEGGVKG